MSEFVSPVSGRPLRADGPHALSDGDETWPVVDGIPYLRTGRDGLVRRVLDALDRGDREGALVALLADQDDWWIGAPPTGEALRRLVRSAETASLRDAMDLLSYERVGHYFAHRWSDPTFMAGTALLDAHWNEPETAFELACGIGHYLRELAGRGIAVSGADVVFSKLWLARHWVAPSAALVCFDAGSPWPVRERSFDLALCHDAFYFLEPKPHVLASLRALLRPGGSLAMAHVHNRDAANLSAGAGMSAAEIAALFPEAVVYEDAALTRAAAEGKAPIPGAARAMRDVEAFSLHEGSPGDAVSVPPRDMGRYRLNPLYERCGGGHAIRWPSPRYEAEYAGAATYRRRIDGEPRPNTASIRRREFLDLPERW